MTAPSDGPSPYPFLPILEAALSGKRAKAICGRLAAHRPVWGSPGYAAVNAIIQDALAEAGLDHVTRETYVYDGKHKYAGMTMPIGWEAESATLDLVSPKRKRIATFPDPPHVLRRWSSGTPARGITAELVCVPVGAKVEDYEGIDVKGKIVLTHNAAMDLAVGRFGALGILSDRIPDVPNCRTRESHPDQVGFGGSAMVTGKPNAGFAFNLSRTQYEEFEALLRRGKVTMRAKVKARVTCTEGVNVVGLVQGAEWRDEEVVLVAHACEPGAIDNASGCAATIHVAETLSDLIARGELPRPKRSIRFAFVHEFYGSAAFLHRRRNGLDKIVGAINLDHVGADQSKSPSVFQVIATPEGKPSYINSCMWDVAEHMPKERAATWGGEYEPYTSFRWRRCRYLTGSDHVKFNEIGVPCAWLVGWPDPFYHAPCDTVDKVGEVEMGRVCLMAATGALAMANAGAAEAERMVALVAGDVEREIGDVVRSTREQLLLLGPGPQSAAARKKGERAIRDRVAAGRKAARSAKVLGRRDSVQARGGLNAALRCCGKELSDAGAGAVASLRSWPK